MTLEVRIDTFLTWVAVTRKGVIAAVTGLAAIASLGILPSPYDKYVATILLIANAIGVHQVSNDADPRHLAPPDTGGPTP